MLERLKTASASTLIIFLLMLLVSYTQNRDEQAAKALECKGTVTR